MAIALHTIMGLRIGLVVTQNFSCTCMQLILDGSRLDNPVGAVVHLDNTDVFVSFSGSCHIFHMYVLFAYI
jgi:hypothetical protein